MAAQRPLIAGVEEDPPPQLAVQDRSMSAPVFPSPRHQHWRAPSMNRQIKETLDARTHYPDGQEGSFYRINQYMIKQEIGRGSFGAVHLAVDQYQNEYAVKEFSKSRLRRRAQSNMLRRRPGQLSQLHPPRPGASQSPVDFIRGEIAVMKKLDHHNLVGLIEVLDDPDEDSLYMVMEMCKKGVVMSVSLDEPADPYDAESCRCWFRDLILAIEYLHAQGVIHRDIKPDNCLLTDDNILKVVDFGVSEIFEKESEMMTSKSAGSPAFMPPELCVPKHGEVSGQAADIWSMGITLYCLRYGNLPFKQIGLIDLFSAILNTEPDLGEDGDGDDDFKDLMHRIFIKDPTRRISMDEMRVHPWVTRHGADPLMSKEENTAFLVEPPTQQEVNHAITGRMTRVLTLMKAAWKFKSLLSRRKPRLHKPSPSFVFDPADIEEPLRRAKTTGDIMLQAEIQVDNLDDSPPVSNALLEMNFGCASPDLMSPDAMVVTDPIDAIIYPAVPAADPEPASVASSYQTTQPSDIHAHPTDGRGQARDPLSQTLFLHIGAGPFAAALDPADPRAVDMEKEYEENESMSGDVCVCESPAGTDENIFERAFWDEISRIIRDDEASGGSGSNRQSSMKRSNSRISLKKSTGGKQMNDRTVMVDDCHLGRSTCEDEDGKLCRRPTLFLTKRVDSIPAVRKLVGSYLAESDQSPILSQHQGKAQSTCLRSNRWIETIQKQERRREDALKKLQAGGQMDGFAEDGPI